MAIVNETMAKRYWPGASAIGKRVRFTDQEMWREVVGIIGDVKHWGLDAPVNPELYVPSSQFPTFAQTFVLLTDGNPLALVPLVQRHVRDLDPNLPLFQVRTMEEVAAQLGRAPQVDHELARASLRCWRWRWPPRAFTA